MRILKSHPLLKMVNSYVIDSPQPSNISYLWNFGSLLALSLGIQIITGVTLGMHYNPNVLEAFDSVEHIMRDVNNGWLIRYLHSNTASAFFFIVYLHIGRGLYYGSYKAPRTLVWTIGTVIFILMMGTAFLGYVLPYGQMSLWGATVITNLMSAIPWVGQDIVEFIWGGFSVNNATLNRFFSLHFVFPFVLAALALMHLITLHDSAGSGNPLGVSGNYDRLPFAPYFLFKDLITIFIFIIAISILVFFMPNILGDNENYVMANPMQTPAAIVPEWYLLPFYAILRSIPNKLLGVIAMFAAILCLLVLPFSDLSKLRGLQFRPLSKIMFFIFVANFLILMQLGAKHVESPFIEFGQISTAIYFSYFLLQVPVISTLENSLMEVRWATNYVIYSWGERIKEILWSGKNMTFNTLTLGYVHLFNIFYCKIISNFFLLRMLIYIAFVFVSGLLSIYLNLEIDYCDTGDSDNDNSSSANGNEASSSANQNQASSSNTNQNPSSSNTNQNSYSANTNRPTYVLRQIPRTSLFERNINNPFEFEPFGRIDVENEPYDRGVASINCLADAVVRPENGATFADKSEVQKLYTTEAFRHIEGTLRHADIGEHVNSHLWQYRDAFKFSPSDTHAQMYDKIDRLNRLNEVINLKR